MMSNLLDKLLTFTIFSKIVVPTVVGVGLILIIMVWAGVAGFLFQRKVSYLEKCGYKRYYTSSFRGKKHYNWKKSFSQGFSEFTESGLGHYKYKDLKAEVEKVEKEMKKREYYAKER